MITTFENSIFFLLADFRKSFYILGILHYLIARRPFQKKGFKFFLDSKKQHKIFCLSNQIGVKRFSDWFADA